MPADGSSETPISTQGNRTGYSTLRPVEVIGVKTPCLVSEGGLERLGTGCIPEMGIHTTSLALEHSVLSSLFRVGCPAGRHVNA